MAEESAQLTDINLLCDVWLQKQQQFESDIKTLLGQANEILQRLDQELPEQEQQQSRLKLDQLIMHLTDELQRRQLEAKADKRLQEWHQSLDNMRQKINAIWQRLGTLGLSNPCEDASFQVQNYTQKSFELLCQQLHQCESLRRQHLVTLIEQVRRDIQKWCDLTLQYPSAWSCQSECCTEELLELLDQKLLDLKAYYNSNKLIFELYAKRTQLWLLREAQEDKSKEPNRFQNRGGQLLREERERKSISMKLPQIEKQLTQLVHEYEQRTQKPFMVYGDPLLERLASDWQEYRLAKAAPLRLKDKVSLRKTFSVPQFN